jgi:hypothetical protein
MKINVNFPTNFWFQILPALVLYNAILIGGHAAERFEGEISNHFNDSTRNATFSLTVDVDSWSIRLESPTESDAIMRDEWYVHDHEVLHSKVFEEPDGKRDYHGFAYRMHEFGNGEPFAEMIAIFMKGVIDYDEESLIEILRRFSTFRVNEKMFSIEDISIDTDVNGVLDRATIYGISPLVEDGDKTYQMAELRALYSQDNTDLTGRIPNQIALKIWGRSKDAHKDNLVFEEYTLTVSGTRVGDFLVEAPNLPNDRSVTVIDGRFDPGLQKIVVYDINDGQWKRTNDPVVASQASLIAERSALSDQKIETTSWVKLFVLLGMICVVIATAGIYLLLRN